MDRLISWLMDYVMRPIMVVCVIALGGLFFIGVPYGIYAAITYVPPTTFTLRVDSWSCTKDHQRDVETCSAKLGCSWRHEIICDEWTRK